jgi:hypothetical protein
MQWRGATLDGEIAGSIAVGETRKHRGEHATLPSMSLMSE